MIKISEASSIAIHAMALLAGLADGERISSNDITKTFGISKNHLSKVMRSLVKKGLVKSDRGPSGGFCMAKSPDKINLLQIYVAIEGNIINNSCLLSKKFCVGNKCVLGIFLSKINKEINDYLTKTKLRDLTLNIEKRK